MNGVHQKPLNYMTDMAGLHTVSPTNTSQVPPKKWLLLQRVASLTDFQHVSP
jgi:hypothetical protein